MFDFAGRVALVTGSGGGIGKGIARVLAEQGAALAIHDIEAENAEVSVAEINASGGHAFPVPFDVTDFDACQAGVRAEMYPLRRVGTANDVAAGVVYLASDEAGWVTGHSLVIKGGGTSR